MMTNYIVLIVVLFVLLASCSPHSGKEPANNCRPDNRHELPRELARQLSENVGVESFAGNQPTKDVPAVVALVTSPAWLFSGNCEPSANRPSTIRTLSVWIQESDGQWRKVGHNDSKIFPTDTCGEVTSSLQIESKTLTFRQSLHCLPHAYWGDELAMEYEPAVKKFRLISWRTFETNTGNGFEGEANYSTGQGWYQWVTDDDENQASSKHRFFVSTPPIYLDENLKNPVTSQFIKVKKSKK